MTRDELRAIAKIMNWSESGYRENWLILKCPLAPWRHGGGTDNNPSFGIEIGNDPPKCICLACGFAGKLQDVLFELVRNLKPGTPSRKRAVKMMQGIPVASTKGPMMPIKTTTRVVRDPLFPEKWLASFPLASSYAEPMKYLMSRNVNNITADKIDIRYDPNNERIGFTIRDWSSTLRGMQGRTMIDAQPKYLFYKYEGKACGHEVLMGEHLIDPEKPVILVEGVFDYAALFPYTKQVLVLWGCQATETRLKRLARLLKIYTAFDNDKAGDMAREKLSASGLPVTNLHLPPGVGDVGDLDEVGLKSLAGHVDSYGNLN